MGRTHGAIARDRIYGPGPIPGSRVLLARPGQPIPDDPPRGKVPEAAIVAVTEWLGEAKNDPDELARRVQAFEDVAARAGHRFSDEPEPEPEPESEVSASMTEAAPPAGDDDEDLDELVVPETVSAIAEWLAEVGDDRDEFDRRAAAVREAEATRDRPRKTVLELVDEE